MTDVEESSFTTQVSERLSELSAEKPTVSQQEIADALGLGDGSLNPDLLEEALDELEQSSVAIKVGTHASKGTMWRHSGLSPEQAEAMLLAQRESDRREAARAAEDEDEKELARERAEEIERDRELAAAEGDGERERPTPRTSGRIWTEGTAAQRVELPMAIAGALQDDAIGAIVTAGIAAAREAGGGFEFVVTA